MTTDNDASSIGMVTDLFIFTKDDNRFVIQGMGTIEGDEENNAFVNLAASMIGSVAGFTKTDEIHHVGKYEEGKTFLPHYPYGIIYSIVGNFEVLLIGGPLFDEHEVKRMGKLN